MPVEIFELVVRANVSKTTSQGTSTTTQPADNQTKGRDCCNKALEQLREFIKRKNER